MTAIPFAIVGFDLDGTLLDTREDLAAAVNHTLAVAGRSPLAAERVAAMIGEGARRMLEQALDATGGVDASTCDHLFAAMLSFYADHIAAHTRPYPAAERVLDDLGAAGVRLALVTNKPERLTILLLDQMGWSGRFACVIGGDTLSARKPSRVPLDEMVARCGGGRAVFVGDTRFDVEAARAAHMPAVLCRFGYGGGAVPGAAAAIDRLDDLVPVLERWS